MVLQFLLMTVMVLRAVSSSKETTAISHAQNQSLFWGTYRPNLYFGTRTRSPETLLTGLMWFSLKKEEANNFFEKIRHTCEQDDKLSGYAWLKHDGRRFGRQTIYDHQSNVAITTQFLKRVSGDHGGDWVVRISGSAIASNEPADISLMFYAGLDGNGALEDVETQSSSDLVYGHSKELGEFAVAFHSNDSNNGDAAQKPFKPVVARFDVPGEDVWKIKDIARQRILESTRERLKDNPSTFAFADVLSLPDNRKQKGNVAVFQQMLTAPFEIDVVFLSGSARKARNVFSASDVTEYVGKALSERLKAAEADYDREFEQTYQLSHKGFQQNKIDFASMLLSNMVGGIGYFHGTSIVDRAWEGFDEEEPVDFLESDGTEETEDEYFMEEGESKRVEPSPRLEGPTSLFSDIPSRPFFPRGFLWDTGFHQLLIGSWDNDLSLDVIKHWASLISDEGWVAREQILGDEARSKVPAEFQVQYPNFANPPTLMLGLKKFVDRLDEHSKSNLRVEPNKTDNIHLLDDLATLRSFHLNSPGAAKTYLEYVYSRFKLQYNWFRQTQWGQISEWGRVASSSTEAYRWRGRKGTHTLTSGLDDYPRSPGPHPGELHVDLLSWLAFYSDTLAGIASKLGKEDEASVFKKQHEDMVRNLHDLHWDDESKTFTDLSVDDNGASYHVVHKGYISLFPFLLGLLKHDEQKLKHVLDLIEDPTWLWTEYGVCSLGKSDGLFQTGENYWRGPIWININYLILHSLKVHYIPRQGPFKSQLERIYKNLRNNLIDNVYKEYAATGYVWEQYGALDGKGKRSHPFTGWTALILLIMAEKY